jgi:hypothetical protein
VFWRDELRVWFDGSFDGMALPVFSLTADADRSSRAVAENWGDGLDNAVLAPEEPLAPLTSYTLTVDACEQTWSVSFTTSAYGSPVEGGGENLLDRSWVLEMGRVNWTEPEGASELLSVFFTEPLLLGVQRVEGNLLDLLVGIGVFTDLNGFEQLQGRGTWDVLGVTLTEQGWFEGRADAIHFTYDGVDIPVYEFGLQGTFSSDGSAIAGASVEGLVDTRNIPLLFGLDQPDFICTTYAADYGLECTPCPDGELLCLDLKGADILLEEQPGLVLVRNDQGG